MITFDHLHFAYRRSALPVLSDLHLHVAAGEVVGLIGRNGAGKTTALHCLLGWLRPHRGQARLSDQDFARSSPEVRARVAFVPQSVALDAALDLATHAAWLAPTAPRWNQARARHLATRWELPWDRPVGQLSGGQRRLASVLLALAREPEILLLDEPAANLDPWARRLLLEELAALLADRPATTVLYSTHLLADLERLSTRVVWLEDGRVSEDFNVEALQDTWRDLTIIFPQEVPPDFPWPGGLPFLRRGRIAQGLARFPSAAARDAFLATPDLEISAQPVSLEEIFLRRQQHKTPNPTQP
jgi:ABC-2 type transport system ATP-binding protein